MDETKPLALCVGDSIRFNDRDDEYGYNNGTTAKVLAVDAKTLTVEMDGTRQVKIDTSNALPLDYNYAITVYKAQGQTYDNAYWLTNGNTSRELGLVAYTRHSQTIGIYTTAEGKEAMAESLTQWQEKKNVRDYAKDWMKSLASTGVELDRKLRKTGRELWEQVNRLAGRRPEHNYSIGMDR